MSEVSVKEVYSELREHFNNVQHKHVDVSAMAVNDEKRQGDVRMRRLPDDWIEQNKHRLERIERFDGLVAEVGANGHKHQLEFPETVEAYRLVLDARGNAFSSPIEGPICRITSPNNLLHEEHGHLQNISPGVYQFPGQRDMRGRVID